MKKSIISKVDIDKLSHINTLGELISHIENEFRKKGEVVCEVRVNDLFLTEQDELKLANSSVSEVNSLEIHTSTIDELVAGAKTTAVHYIKKLQDASLTLAQNYRAGQLEEAMQLNHAIINGVEWVFSIMTQIKGLAVPEHDISEWTKQESQFAEVASEVVAAFQQDDHVLLADILEYDWCNALDNWSRLLDQLKVKESTDHHVATDATENNSMV